MLGLEMNIYEKIGIPTYVSAVDHLIVIIKSTHKMMS